MTPEEPEAKATVQMLYHEIGESRREVNVSLVEMNDRMEVRFASVLQAVESLRGSMVAEPVCQERRSATTAATATAVSVSSDDREKLWESVHGIEAQLKWAASAIIVSFLSIIGYLVQAHLWDGT